MARCVPPAMRSRPTSYMYVAACLSHASVAPRDRVPDGARSTGKTGDEEPSDKRVDAAIRVRNSAPGRGGSVPSTVRHCAPTPGRQVTRVIGNEWVNEGIWGTRVRVSKSLKA